MLWGGGGRGPRSLHGETSKRGLREERVFVRVERGGRSECGLEVKLEEGQQGQLRSKKEGCGAAGARRPEREN